LLTADIRPPCASTLHQRDDLPDDVIDVEQHFLNFSLIRERPDAPESPHSPDWLRLMIQSTAHRAFPDWGYRRRFQRRQAAAALTTAASGWFTSWAIEAANSPIVVTR